MSNVLNISGPIKVGTLASDPSNPQEGYIYFNSTNGNFRMYENGSFRDISAEELEAHLADDSLIKHDADQVQFQDSAASGKNVSLGPVENALTALDDTLGDFTSATYGNYTDPGSDIVVDHFNALDTALGTKANDADVIKKDGSVAFTGNQSMGSNKLTNLAAPTNAQDAATKAYVDSIEQGLDVKDSVRAASTANVDLTVAGDGTLDGVTLANGDRVLLKDQTTASENGIYDAVTATDRTTWVRSADADEDSEVTAGMFMFVEEGTSNADSGWVLTTDDPITVGTTALSFTQFSGAGQIEAGAGLTKSGNTLNVGDANKGVQVNTDDLEIDASESSGDGIKQNATNSWQFDVEADTSSTTTTEANALNVSANGVNVKVDDSTLEGSSQGAGGTESLRVKDGGITDAKLSTGLDASKIADGSVSNTEFQHLDGTTSDIQPQLDSKLENVVEDTTPQLGGNLDTNANAVLHDGDGLKRGNVATPSSLVQEEYIDSITLSASQTDTVISELSFNSSNFEGAEIVYKIKEATSGDVRIGTLRVVTNGTDIVINDVSTETADTGISFNAQLNTGTVEITYSSGSNGATMRADMKRIRA